MGMETKFWVNAGMWSLVAQDRELNLTDMRTLVFVMSQNEDGACPMSLSQMGGVLDIDRASLSRSLRKLDKLGYIEKTDGGWILRSCFMFMGKRNQQNKVNRMEQAMTIKERRLRFREKIEAEGHDNRPGWTGYRQLPDGSWKLDGGPGVRWEGEPYTGPCPLENFNG